MKMFNLVWKNLKNMGDNIITKFVEFIKHKDHINRNNSDFHKLEQVKTELSSMYDADFKNSRQLLIHKFESQYTWLIVNDDYFYFVIVEKNNPIEIAYVGEKEWLKTNYSLIDDGDYILIQFYGKKDFIKSSKNLYQITMLQSKINLILK